MNESQDDSHIYSKFFYTSSKYKQVGKSLASKKLDQTQSTADYAIKSKTASNK